MIARLPAFVLVILLAACTPGSGIIAHRTVDYAYTFDELTSKPSLPLEIRGNPFAAPPERLAGVLSATMYDAHFGPPVAFVPAAGDVPLPYAVRLLFNGPIASDHLHFCLGPPPPVAPAPGQRPVRLLAGFCRDGLALTYLTAELPAADGPDDPRFVAFVRMVTMALFPTDNPELRDRGCLYLRDC
ncbi:MAG: hypothetical protein U1E53_21510 [Dongiaceae bacterium]